MSDLRLALTYLRHRLLVTILTVISVALGLGLAVTVLTMTHQTRNTLGNETAFADIVVGGEGGPLQLVLNTLYYLDPPTGNIDLALWDKLKHDPAVSSVIPLNMGDNYLGAPIVGTVPEFFSGRKPLRGDKLVAQGRLFAKPFEAVVGADVARRGQMTLGQQVMGAHGWGKSGDVHAQFPYTVVGILAPTGSSTDRGVYTDYHSVWIVHSHHHADGDADEGTAHEEGDHDPTKELTALLVTLSEPARRYLMVQDLNRHENAMAVIPVNEISTLIQRFVTPLQGVLLAVAYLVIAIASLTILITLYLTIYQRRRDLAVSRALGATRLDIFRLITVEAAALSGLGVIGGFLLGHGMVALAAPLAMEKLGILPNPWLVAPLEWRVAISVWVIGIIAGLLPAAIAYRLPVVDTLVKE
jgi:putative ABC transport system permease protein